MPARLSRSLLLLSIWEISRVFAGVSSISRADADEAASSVSSLADSSIPASFEIESAMVIVEWVYDVEGSWMMGYLNNSHDFS